MSEIELHRKLLGDSGRNQAFAEALKRVIKPGQTQLLDIGAGTGFLSFLARRLGAAHATLIEYSDALELAEALARRNRIEQLSFIKTHSSELRRKLAVDVVVTETLGNFALEEGFLETALDARRFLKPGGLIIPGRLRQYVAPVLQSRVQDEIDIWPGVGFDLDLQPAREISLSNMYVRTLRAEDLGGDASLARLWDDLDLRPQSRAPSSDRRSRSQWQAPELRQRTVHGFALWWETELLEGLSLSTSPLAAPTHWEQIYLPLLQAITLAPDEQLELELRCDTRPQTGVRLQWTARVQQHSKTRSQQALDSWRGRL
ncbi:protein arginine N-methyltransferase 1 [Solimonas aquatica]|uniref:Protein arginine N-methyltransferase 1 n=1 Tax=Solimonas aquatica TaxID=489703 RepID=A0A1H9CNS2_9GAMM|nr:class I SAM-dependent methyltransferase [Solimonas aquatica]SEQ02865.1 protein arginine N-methyltransferase 1 [Solimonas aquatica]